jgi:hypothetical protein
MGFWFYILITVYITGNYYLACWIYKQSTKFYNNNPLHNKTLEFKSYDKLSFTRILIGMELLFWPRFIIIAIVSIFSVLALK